MSGRGATRIVGYFVKGTRPKDPKRASALQALAYQACESVNIEPKEILIRGDIHNTTTINGKTGVDPRGFHLTVSFRSEEDIKNNTFISAHAYTPSRDDFTLKSATLGAVTHKMSDKGRGNKPIWPQGLSNEDIFYVDPSTGPEPEKEPAPQGHDPSTGGHTPSTGGHPTSTGGHPTSTEGHVPSTGGHPTSTGGHPTSTEGHVPSTGSHIPSTGSHVPSAGHSTGHASGAPPSTTKSSSSHGIGK